MDLAELKQQITTKILRSFYVFTGEDQEVLRTYIKKIVEVSGMDMVIGAEFSQVYSGLKNVSLVSKPFVYVFYEDKEYTQQDPSVFAKTISGQAIGNNIVIMVYATIDKRTKFYNSHKDIIVEFEKLSPHILLKMVQSKFKCSQDNANRLINRCGENYGKILLEGDKASYISKIYNISIDKAFEKAFDEDLISIQAENVSAMFLEDLADGDRHSVWFFLQILRGMDEPTLKLLSNMYNMFKPIYQIQSCPAKMDITKKTGLAYNTVQTYKDKTGIFSEAALLRALESIRRCEVDIKSGRLPENICIEKCLCDIFLTDQKII